MNPRIFGASASADPLARANSTRLMRTEIANVSLNQHRSRLSVRWVARGSYTYEVEGQRYLLRPGNFLIINHGQHYNSAMEDKELTECFTLSFDPLLASDVATSLSLSQEWRLEHPLEVAARAEPAFFVNTYGIEGAFRNLFEEFVRVGRGDFQGVSLEDSFYGLMEQLFVSQHRVERSLSRIPAVRRATREELYRRVSRARDFIHAHSDRNLSVESISSEARLSPAHFLRVFKQAFGLSPHQYLLNLRLNRARTLMVERRERVPLGLIAIECGFEDLSSFSKAFKQRFGVAPVASNAEGQASCPKTSAQFSSFFKSFFAPLRITAGTLFRRRPGIPQNPFTASVN
jgi:AraC family transcriptional regulator